MINSRKTHYFYPKKKFYEDYNCNLFVDEIDRIKKDWEDIFKPLIERESKRIEKPQELVAADDLNFQCGITDYDESQIWAIKKNWENQTKYQQTVYKIIYSLYAQFFHMMASRIEAVTIRVLAKNGKDVEHFDRNALYDYAGTTGTARTLEHFKFHDKLYCIWHFIKHNSISTYEKLKEKFPEVLYDDSFKQGNIGASYVKFDEKLIIDLLDGCIEFFKEYCAVVYNENYNEAQWNYDNYFESLVQDEIDSITDPLGLKYY